MSGQAAGELTGRDRRDPRRSRLPWLRGRGTAGGAPGAGATAASPALRDRIQRGVRAVAATLLASHPIPSVLLGIWALMQFFFSPVLGSLSDRHGRRPVILAIPRGAVPMGKVIAERLGGELDLVLVRKLHAPGAPEFAVGAIDDFRTVPIVPRLVLQAAEKLFASRGLHNVSMQDIADAAGVSRMAVSYALRNNPKVPSETRERIKKIAERLGYDTLFTWDHLLPIVGSADGPIHEGWTTLTAWAMATEPRPIMWAIASRVFGCWRPVASPRIWRVISAIWPTPVGPMGWPMPIRPPEALTAQRPPMAVSPRARSWAPSPGRLTPMASP